MRRWAAVLPIGVFLVTLAQAVAQPKDGEFYEDDFVHDMFDNQARRADVTPVPSPTVKTVPTLTPDQIAWRKANLGERREDEPQGIPVRALSIVLRAEPRDQLVAALKEYAAALNSHERIVRGNVFVVGSPYEYSREEESAIARETGVLGLMYDFEPPEFLKGKIKRVPTWILETDQGKVLIEAQPSLSRFLNSAGEFIEPAPTPAGTGGRGQ